MTEPITDDELAALQRRLTLNTTELTKIMERSAAFPAIVAQLAAAVARAESAEADAHTARIERDDAWDETRRMRDDYANLTITLAREREKLYAAEAERSSFREAIAKIYTYNTRADVAVIEVCDMFLDKSGALLERIQKEAYALKGN